MRIKHDPPPKLLIRNSPYGVKRIDDVGWQRSISAMGVEGSHYFEMCEEFIESGKNIRQLCCITIMLQNE